MPAHEQADEYRTIPEQAEAYVGTFVGAFVLAAQVPGEVPVVVTGTRALIRSGKVGAGGSGITQRSRFGGETKVTVVVLNTVLVTWTADGSVMVRVSSIVLNEVNVSEIVFSWVASVAVVTVTIYGDSVAMTVVIVVEVLYRAFSQGTDIGNE